MKKIFILIISILSLVSVSCEKFLETDSPSTFTKDYIFNREEDVFRVLKGVYALLTQDAGYSIRLSYYYTVNTDVEMIIGASDGGRRDIAEFVCKTTNSEVLNPWNNLYNAINRANECIQGIENSSLYKTNANVMQMYGEAVALRSLLYYELVRNWGDVPYKTTPTVAGDNFYLPRTERDTILAACIRDLIRVEPEMYYANHSQLPEGIERINRGFVQGLIARIALARGGYSLRQDMTMKRNESDYLYYYQVADTYAKKLVGSGHHHLNSNFKQVFLNECQFKTPADEDVLYEVAYPATYSGETGYYIGIKMVKGNHNFGSASGSVALTPTYFYSFDTADNRLPVTCAYYSLDQNLKQVIASPTGGITVGKWCKAWMTTEPGSESTKGTGINWPLMRYSDVLLMLAEAENELNNGPTADAIDALKQVRERAFSSSTWAEKVDHYVDSVSANKQAFFNALVNERSWELGGECIRKFDLVRWNLYGEKIAETRRELIQMGLDTRLGTGNGKYANYPDKIYWEYGPDGSTLQVIGLYSKITTVPDGYTTANWLMNLVGSDGTPSAYISDMYAGYTDNTGLSPVRYILPIHQTVISASNGALENYYNY